MPTKSGRTYDMPGETNSRCRKPDCDLCNWRRTHEKRINGVIHYPRSARMFSSPTRMEPAMDEVKMTPEQEDHLDSLSESGIQNFIEATNSLMKEFDLKKQEAAAIVKLYAEKKQQEAMQ